MGASLKYHLLKIILQVTCREVGEREIWGKTMLGEMGWKGEEGGGVQVPLHSLLCYSGQVCATTGQQESAQKCDHQHFNVGIEESNGIPWFIIKNASIQKRKVLCFTALKVKPYISSLGYLFSNYTLNLLEISHLEVMLL